jgi:hypothetical protein
MLRRRRRAWFATGVTVVLGGLYAWLFGFQTMMIWKTSRIARKAPIVKQIPRALADTSVSTRPGTRLSYFGYDFEVPWNDLNPDKTQIYPNRVVLTFGSGRYLMFSTVPPRHFVNILQQQMGQDSFSRTLDNDAALQSDYAMWNLVLRATPDSVNLFSPRKDIARNSMLVLIKGVTIPETSGLYFVETRGLRGFQWGDPRRRPGRVVTDLFADDGGVEFVFSGRNKQNPSGASQAEINRVLQSVRLSFRPELP